MTKIDTAAPPTLAAGAEFARQVRDPEFRAYLRRAPKGAARNVVIALDDEPFVQVIARMAFNDTSSPCLIAIPRSAERFGFGILVAKKVPPRLVRKFRREQAVELPAASSIGMLYDALIPSEPFVPPEWTVSSVQFERIPMPG